MPTSLAWHRGRAGKTRQPPAGSWVFTWQTEAEGRLWGVGGADALVPAACLALMPPAARRWCIRARLPPAHCVHRVWVEGCTLSPRCWGSSPRELERPGEQVGGDARPAPGAQPCPSLIPLPLSGMASCWQHRPANPLSTLSPSKLRPIPHPFNKQPLCQAVCRGKQKLREGAGSPLAQTTPPPSPAAHQLGDLAQVAALLRSLSLWLYRAVRLLLTSTSWRHPRYSISQGRYSV